MAQIWREEEKFRNVSGGKKRVSINRNSERGMNKSQGLKKKNTAVKRKQNEHL